MIGIAALLATPRPDLLVTGDGRHIAAAQPDGSYALLRDRAGDYVRDTVAEAAGIDAPLLALADLDHVECNRDFCRWTQGRDRAWRVILASHGRDRRSEEHTSELQSLMRISYAVFCLPKQKDTQSQ